MIKYNLLVFNIQKEIGIFTSVDFPPPIVYVFFFYFG